MQKSCVTTPRWVLMKLAIFVLAYYSFIADGCPYTLWERYNTAVIVAVSQAEYAGISAQCWAFSWIDRSRFAPTLIVIERDGWCVRPDGEGQRSSISATSALPSEGEHIGSFMPDRLITLVRRRK